MGLGRFVIVMMIVDAAVVVIAVILGLSMWSIMGWAVATLVACQLAYLGWIAVLARDESRASQDENDDSEASEAGVVSNMARQSGKR